MHISRLASLPYVGVSLDLESHLSQPGLPWAPIVCGATASMTGPGQCATSIHSVEEIREVFLRILNDEKWTLVNANVAFDILSLTNDFAQRGIDVWPQVFNMYDPRRTVIRGDVDGRVYCTLIAEALHAVGRGILGLDPRTMKPMKSERTGKRSTRYSHSRVCEYVLGVADAKEHDEFRLIYYTLRHLHPSQYPPKASQYPQDDARLALLCALGQQAHIPAVGVHFWGEGTCLNCGQQPGQSETCVANWQRLNAHEIGRKTYLDFCLHLGSGWGFLIDQSAVDELENDYNKQHAHEIPAFVEAGFLRPNGTEDQSAVKKAIVLAYGCNLHCAPCGGTGKVPSPVTQGRTKINCASCDGTGIHLTQEVPLTETGRVAISRDALMESGSEFMRRYGSFKEADKTVDLYIPFFRKGRVTYPDGTWSDVPLNLNPNPVLETGRVSYSEAFGTLPRQGKFRQCITTYPGWTISSSDYQAGELVTHAQSCLWIAGFSELATALNSGEDVHLSLAAYMLQMQYEEAKAKKKAGDKRVVDARQAKKPENFGYPGRMGPFKLVVQQRKQGPDTPHPSGPIWIQVEEGKPKVRGYKGLRFCLLQTDAQACGTELINQWAGRTYKSRVCKRCVECAAEGKVNWLKRWPENKKMFERVSYIEKNYLSVVQHYSKRIRGFRHGMLDDEGEPINVGNSIANGWFQGLLADISMDAYCAATRECYDKTVIVESYTDDVSDYEGGPSPLYGSRIPHLPHDEFVALHPPGMGHDGAWRIAELMIESMRIKCPDLYAAASVTPALMRRLYKKAEAVYDSNGRLVPWEPKNNQE